MATSRRSGTVLRQRMLEDLQLRGLAAKTQDAYVRAVRQLAESVAAAEAVAPAERVLLCPHCGQPMRLQRPLPARARCPP